MSEADYRRGQESVAAAVMAVIESGGKRYGVTGKKSAAECEHGGWIYHDCIECYDQSIIEAMQAVRGERYTPTVETRKTNA